MTQVSAMTEDRDAQYFAADGLSQSGMKDLAVSPYRYWYLHLNPNRPAVEPTPEMQIGSALHCLMLEPDQFEHRYACKFSADGMSDVLHTAEDIREFIRSRGGRPSGARKSDLIQQAQSIDSHVLIFDVLERDHEDQHSGKVIFSPEDWQRIHGMAESLRSEPRVQQILSEGKSEVPMFAKDPDTGAVLKAKMDYVGPHHTADLKTFTQRKGKSIDRSIADAILYERYHVQAYTYDLIRKLNGEQPKAFILIFAESQEPHEVRIRSLRPKSGTEPNLYWTRAMLEVRQMIRTYADCMEQFGTDKPWRSAQEIVSLTDEEMPGLAW